MPPFGAVFMADAPETEIEDWLRRAPDQTDERGSTFPYWKSYSTTDTTLLAAGPEAVQQHQAILSEFELRPPSPSRTRGARGDLGARQSFFTGLVGERYDLANIVVLSRRAGVPPMALRVTGLPPAMTVQVETRIAALEMWRRRSGPPAAER